MNNDSAPEGRRPAQSEATPPEAPANELTHSPKAATAHADPSIASGSPVGPDPDLSLEPAHGGSDMKRSTKAERQEIFLPVTGFVWLYPEEVKVVNHPAFQRLGRIYQLGQTNFVYRGATHKRIEHALGCIGIVQQMIEAIEHTSEKAAVLGQPSAAPLSEEEQRFVRLGALLHDVGHIAAGHTLEDELHLIGKHDEDDRLDIVFGATLADREGRDLRTIIDTAYAAWVPTALSLSPSSIVRLLIRKPPDRDDRYGSESRQLAETPYIRMQVCRDMIGDTICADLLDYLYRDWYHVGKARPSHQRIYQYMEIRSGAATSVHPERLRRHDDKLVISLGRRPKLRTDAVSAILELLEWRYQLAESVLYHRAKLAAAAMLDRALWELWENENSTTIERIVLALSDEQLLDTCAELGRKRGDPAGTVAATLLGELSTRTLHCHLTTRFSNDLPSGQVTRLQQTFGKKPAARTQSMRQLEHDFCLPAGSVTMYCPTNKMNAKIAEVKIAVDDAVEAFYKYEEDNEDQLSGGHLDAQLKRFKRLWRVHFFMDRRVSEKNAAQLPLIREAIDRLVLSDPRDEANSQRAARQIAIQLSHQSGSPWAGRTVRETPLMGTSPEPTQLGRRGYVFGAPSIAAFFDSQTSKG